MNQKPAITIDDLGAIYSAVADHLATTQLIKAAIEVMGLESIEPTIMTWLKEHGIQSDINFIDNIDRLIEELNAEWQQEQ